METVDVYNFQDIINGFDDPIGDPELLFLIKNDITFEYTVDIPIGITATFQTDRNNFPDVDSFKMKAPNELRHFSVNGTLIIEDIVVDGSNISPLDIEAVIINGTDISPFGGGIKVVDGGALILNAGGAIYGNIASLGGGIQMTGDATLTMEDGSTINQNIAYEGAGIYADGGTILINSGAISHNDSVTTGGGIQLNHGTQLTIGVEPITDVDEETGEITITPVEVDITIQLNGALEGAGIYVDAGNVQMYGGEIINNTASQTGGGVQLANGAGFSLNDGHINDNTASEVSGGGFQVGSGTTLIMNDGSINGNISQSGAGIYTDGEVIMNAGEINENYATISGGGVQINSGTFRMYSISIWEAIESGDSDDSGEDEEGVILLDDVSGDNGGIILLDDSNDDDILLLDDTSDDERSDEDTGDEDTTSTAATINKNQATRGAGVYIMSGAFILNGGNVSENKASESGGGVYLNLNTTFEMGSQGTIHHNLANTGAGIYLSGSTQLQLNDGNITENKAMINGGGLFISRGAKVTLGGNVYVEYNQSPFGGGAYVSGTLTLNGANIRYNNAEDPSAGTMGPFRGAGVYVSTFGSVVMNSGRLDGNVCYNGTSENVSGGAGAYVEGTFTLNEGSIYQNTAFTPGCGAYVTRTGNFVLMGGRIDGNITNLSGGGVYLEPSGILNMRGGYIMNNRAYCGGGVCCYGLFTLTTGEIYNNTATTESMDPTEGGGGIYVASSGAKLDVKAGNIYENITTASYGGGVHINGAMFTMQGGMIQTNRSQGGGAGIWVVNNGTLTVQKGSAITGNTASVTDGFEVVSGLEEAIGGGIGAYNGSTITLNEGVINYNRARYGGGIAVIDAILYIQNAEIKSNVAGFSGGGIYADTDGLVTMENGLISDNSAVNGGGVYVVGDASLNIMAGTISDNTADEDGGGIYTGLGTVTIIGEDDFNVFPGTYDNIKTGPTTIFARNKASVAYLCTMTFPDIQWAETSVPNFPAINNYDINYNDHNPAQTFLGIFPDYNLATVIAGEFELTANDYTSKSQLQTLKELEAVDQDIESLEGMNEFVDGELFKLNLDKNKIIDISPLKDLLGQLTNNLSIHDQKAYEKHKYVGISTTNTEVKDENGDPIPFTVYIGNGHCEGNTFFWYEAGVNYVRWDYKDYFSGTVRQRAHKRFISSIFEDDNLALAVAKVLNKRVSAPINLTELYSITSFKANNQGITNLKGMQFMSSLNSLTLNQNGISDLTPILNLNLDSLRLDDNNISNLTNLKIAQLTSLTKLSLNDNQIVDVSELVHLTNLEALLLQGNEITNFNALLNLKSLNVLYLNDNLIESENLQDFSSLPELTLLRLDHNLITDLETLTGLNKIEKLCLSSNQIDNIEALKNFTTLKILELNRNNLTTVLELLNLTNLFALELNDNNIPLSEIENLKATLLKLWFLEYNGG